MHSCDARLTNLLRQRRDCSRAVLVKQLGRRSLATAAALAAARRQNGRQATARDGRCGCSSFAGADQIAVLVQLYRQEGSSKRCRSDSGQGMIIPDVVPEAQQ